MVCNMENKLDIATIVSAVGVAVYAALAIRHVALYDLGFSFQQIRGAAMVIAAVILAVVAVDFFDKQRS